MNRRMVSLACIGLFGFALVATAEEQAAPSATKPDAAPAAAPRALEQVKADLDANTEQLKLLTEEEKAFRENLRGEYAQIMATNQAAAQQDDEARQLMERVQALDKELADLRAKLQRRMIELRGAAGGPPLPSLDSLKKSTAGFQERRKALLEKRQELIGEYRALAPAQPYAPPSPPRVPPPASAAGTTPAPSAKPVQP